MGFIVLTEQDVYDLLPMGDAVCVAEQALIGASTGEITFPLRTVVRLEGVDEMLGLMPAHHSGEQPAFGLKATCIVPSNPARGLDSHQGAVLLFDGASGELRAVIHGASVTAIRTAASSAVATRVLAGPKPDRLAILGSGFQARWHLRMLAHVLSIARVTVWSRNPAHATAFAERARNEKVEFEIDVAPDVESAVTEATVIVTATASAEPLIDRRWIGPGTHINAVGAATPTTREIDGATVRAAAVFVDSRESALVEAGDLLLAYDDPTLVRDHIRAELGEVLTGRGEGRRSTKEITLYKSLGIAAQDLAAGEFLVARAKASGRGAYVSF